MMLITRHMKLKKDGLNSKEMMMYLLMHLLLEILIEIMVLEMIMRYILIMKGLRLLLIKKQL